MNGMRDMCRNIDIFGWICKDYLLLGLQLFIALPFSAVGLHKYAKFHRKMYDSECYTKANGLNTSTNM